LTKHLRYRPSPKVTQLSADGEEAARHEWLRLLPASPGQCWAANFAFMHVKTMPPLSVVMITLRNRTLSRTVELFLDCARDVAKSIDRKRRAEKP